MEVAGSGGDRMQHSPARFLHRLHHGNLGKTGTGNHQGSSHVIREHPPILRLCPDACLGPLVVKQQTIQRASADH
jgi:hypothetical protein